MDVMLLASSQRLECWLCSQISCTLLKMDCIVFTKDINASLDVYVFVALLLCADPAQGGANCCAAAAG